MAINCIIIYELHLNLAHFLSAVGARWEKHNIETFQRSKAYENNTKIHPVRAWGAI